jgi:hypothetical protein
MQVIIAVVAALISGFAATWYQLRRQRARLYAMPLSYTWELGGGQAMVTIPGEVAGQLSQSVYLTGYSATAAELSLVQEAVEACAEIQTDGPPLREALTEVVAAVERGDDDARLKASLRSPLRMPLFDKFLMAAANGRALADSDKLIQQAVRTKGLIEQWEQSGKPPASVPMFISPNDGSYQFGLPGGPVVVGKDLKKWPVALQELPPLLQSLRFLDRPLLQESFDQLVTLLTTDLQIAAEVGPGLGALLAEHFCYVCRLYMANYGAAPAMIQARATVQMRSGGRSLDPIPCHLVAVGSDNGIARTENGFLLSAGSDVNVAFVSDHEQREMPELQEALGQAAGTPCEVRAEFTWASSASGGLKTVRSRWISPTLP